MKTKITFDTSEVERVYRADCGWCNKLFYVHEDNCLTDEKMEESFIDIGLRQAYSKDTIGHACTACIRLHDLKVGIPDD